MSFTKFSVSTLALIAMSATAAAARDEICRVGSSAVFPYPQAVADQFTNNTGNPSPIVESRGTGGGMQLFCGGIGKAHPDLTGASHAIKKSEYDLCVSNDVTGISKALIGFDGLSMGVSRNSDFDWDLTLGETYLALVAMGPVDGEWVDNLYKKWSEIDTHLPDTDIVVIGPPPTSGTRDAFVKIAMHAGCQELDYVKDGGFDGDWVNENCPRMRTDGPFVEAGENDNLIVQQRLQSDPNALGIFGYPFVYENLDTLVGVKLNGVELNFETIVDKSFPVSRPLYTYIRNAHRVVIPGFEEFIAEYMSEDALAPGGYLSERGLVPLVDARRAALREAVMSG